MNLGGYLAQALKACGGIVRLTSDVNSGLR